MAVDPKIKLLRNQEHRLRMDTLTATEPAPEQAPRPGPVAASSQSGPPVDISVLRDNLDVFNAALEPLSPTEILRWTARMFGASASLSCSFGGPSGMILLDILARESMPFGVYFIDTGFLFPETYDPAREVQDRYGSDLHRYFPRLSLAEQAASAEDALWERDPDLCCSIRKVEPNLRALQGQLAWIAGLRRDQSAGRADAQVLSWSDKFGVFKIAPLVTWSEEAVWEYIRQHDVPYNALHDRGLPSLGCTHCTTAPDGADLRSGRWAGSAKTECGLHI